MFKMCYKPNNAMFPVTDLCGLKCNKMMYFNKSNDFHLAYRQSKEEKDCFNTSP